METKKSYIKYESQLKKLWFTDYRITNYDNLI